jgi:hypothetical protein
MTIMGIQEIGTRFLYEMHGFEVRDRVELCVSRGVVDIYVSGAKIQKWDENGGVESIAEDRATLSAWKRGAISGGYRIDGYRI